MVVIVAIVSLCMAVLGAENISTTAGNLDKAYFFRASPANFQVGLNYKKQRSEKLNWLRFTCLKLGVTSYLPELSRF